MSRRCGMKNKKRWIIIGILMAAIMATAGFAMGDTPGQLSGKTPAQPAQRNDALGVDVGDFNIEGGKQGKDYTYDDDTGVLTIKSTKGMMISNQSDVDTTSDRIEITSKANLTLAGVNIETKSGPALEVKNSNVTITLADGTTNTLTSIGSGYAGLQKSSATAISSSGLTIQGGKAGTGSLIATGGKSAAGIGGGLNGNGNNITISGGTVTVKGGDYGAGIGGGGTDDPFGKRGKSGRNIIIRGGKVEATAGFGAAGIGGGMRGTASNITISGGTVTANGGYYGSGIGSGYNAGESSGNKLAGNAVVFATSGGSTSVEALGGFSLTQGIAFTRKGDSGSWSKNMYGDVAMGTDATFPADLTIVEGQTLSVKEGVTLTIADGATLYNKGTLNADAVGYGIIDCPSAKSKVLTYVKYNPDGGTGAPNDHYVVYKENGSQQKYAGNAPELTKTDWCFVGWYADADKNTSPVIPDMLVVLNEHTLYARWAERPFEVTGGTEHTDWEYDRANGVLYILTANHELTIKNVNPAKAMNQRIEISQEIKEDQTVKLTLAGVNINTGSGPALGIADSAAYNETITLADGTTNTLKTTNEKCAGLQKNGDTSTGTLTIQGGHEGTGSLIAAGGSEAAGIGSGYEEDGSNITITDGMVTATGGWHGAGIGGGECANGKNIMISGGKVEATGGSKGSGIGGGYGYIYGDKGSGTGSNITISGGQVEATGGTSAAGIGGGFEGDGRDIIISGGEVKGTGRKYGAGIGGGDMGSGSDITISGGQVEATGGTSAAGIGGGMYGAGSGNELNGDAVVKATGDQGALDGFDGKLTQGIAFTRDSISSAWAAGTMYGSSVAVTGNVSFPANLTIPEGKTLTVNKGVTLTVPNGVTLKNEGTLTTNGSITCKDTGRVTTLLQYGGNGGTPDASSKEYTYLDSSATAKTYGELATATRDGYTFAGWYDQAEGGAQILASDKVNVNLHTVYAHWTAK